MKLKLIKNSDFIFRTKLFRIYEMELPFLEHIEELRQRIFQLITIFISATILIFINVRTLVELIEKPVTTIKFIQLSPGEYLVSTIKIAIYAGLLICVPIILSQIVYFIFPGLTLREKKFILPLISVSFALFILGINFSYTILIPAALKFFVGPSFWYLGIVYQYLCFFILLHQKALLSFKLFDALL